MEELKVTFIQADLKWEDKQANLDTFDRLISQLVEPGDIIILPEMFTTGFSMNSSGLAETMDGEGINWMRRIARQTNSAVVGSVIIKEDGQYYNRLVWMNPDASYYCYDKKHLFSLAKENEHYSPGRSKLIVEYKNWKICPMICYDLRFPEWSKNSEHYDLLIYVANWPRPRISHWSALLRARAVENQCYVIGVNRVGTDGNGLGYSGNSSIYNFNGDQIVEKIDTESVSSHKLMKLPLVQFRKKLPFLEDQDLISER